jgi:hypothetical protein
MRATSMAPTISGRGGGAGFVDLFRQEPDGSWYMDLDSFDEIEEAPLSNAKESANLTCTY